MNHQSCLTKLGPLRLFWANISNSPSSNLLQISPPCNDHLFDSYTSRVRISIVIDQILRQCTSY